MRRSAIYAVLGLLGIAAALGLMAWVFLQGRASAGAFVIFPFVISSSPWFALGLLLLIVGVLALSASSWARFEEEEEAAPARRARVPAGGTATAGPSAPRVSYGGFLLIGPVPIVFGNRPGWLRYLIALAAITVVALLIFVLLALYAG